MNLGYTHAFGSHSQLNETEEETHHTVRQKTRGIDGRCVDHWTDWLIGHTDKNCCENKAADHRTKEKKYWLVTAQTPCDYESGLF